MFFRRYFLRNVIRSSANLQACKNMSCVRIQIFAIDSRWSRIRLILRLLLIHGVVNFIRKTANRWTRICSPNSWTAANIDWQIKILRIHDFNANAAASEFTDPLIHGSLYSRLGRANANHDGFSTIRIYSRILRILST